MTGRAGVVVEFDEVVGLGVIEAAADGRRYPFHCTQIADGTRAVPVGASVTFSVIPGRGGVWEAAGISVAVAG